MQTPGLTRLRASLTVVLALLGAAGPAAAAEYTVKLAYVAQPTNPFHAGMEYLAKRVAEKSSGPRCPEAALRVVVGQR